MIILKIAIIDYAEENIKKQTQVNLVHWKPYQK